MIVLIPPAGSGSGSGHVIEDEGTPLTQRDTINFVGAGVAVTDAGGKTVVTIAGGAGSPGGADTQVQFNDAGAFGGSSTLTFVDTAGAEQLSFIGGAASGFVVNVGSGDLTLNTSGTGGVDMLTAGGDIDIDALTGSLILAGDPIDISSGTAIDVIASSGEILLDASSGVKVSTRTGTPATMAAYTSAGVLCETVDVGLCEARLTLSPNHAVYEPQPATPSSTDTGTEVITFAVAHGWVTGTVFTVSVTGGNLTAGTTYYLRALSTTTIAAYTTLANALADSSRVNLSASITAEIRPAGVAQTTLWLLPYAGKTVALHTGSAWVLYTIPDAGLSKALAGLLTSGSVYDVFLDYNDGTPQLAFSTAWTSATVRAAELGVQDTIPVKSGDTQQRWIGTVRANATDTLVVIPGRNQTAGGVLAAVNETANIGIWNADERNRVPVNLIRQEQTSSWTYTTATLRQVRASGTNQVEVVSGAAVPIHVTAMHRASQDNAAIVMQTAIGKDSTSASLGNVGTGTTSNPAGQNAIVVADLNDTPFGYHYYAWLELSGAGVGTTTWKGAGPTGILARWRY